LDHLLLDIYPIGTGLHGLSLSVDSSTSQL